jgi:hypothetical protein
MKKKKSSKPGTLRATDKVASVGPVLGGNPKKGTLSKKFFGCGITPEIGDREVLDEATRNQFAKLKKVNIDHPAALITPKNHVYVGRMHYELRDVVARMHDDPSLLSGTVRVRFAGTVGYAHTVIEFANKDEATLQRVFAALEIRTPGDWFTVEYSVPPLYPSWKGKKDEVKEEIQNWATMAEPEPVRSYSPAMAFWRESKNEKTRKVLSYKEFQNASHATKKVCPSCQNTFKNVHSVDQQFCSLPCEKDGGLTSALQEAFSKFV